MLRLYYAILTLSRLIVSFWITFFLLVITNLHCQNSYIQIFIFTGFIINLLLETTEKGEPPPSGLGSPPLLKYIIKLSFIMKPDSHELTG